MSKTENPGKTFCATVAYSGQSLYECFSETELPTSRIKQCQKYGALWQQKPSGRWQRLRKLKPKLHEGQKLCLHYLSSLYQQPLLAATLIADNGDYSVWHKPYGMLSQGTKYGDINTVYRYSELNLKPERPAFLLHRLDRAAQGLQIIAHNKKAAKAFSQMFEQRALVKTYLAKVQVAEKPPREGVICHEIDGKPADTSWCLLDYQQLLGQALLEVNIGTGRKHQIRKHLSGAGMPIVGDRLYGHGPFSEDLQLLAWRLAFTCPITGQAQQFQTPVNFTL